MSLAQILLGAAAKTKVTPRFAPFYAQAANEALVRYAPEWENLNLVREQSARDMRQRIQQANIAGAMISDAANRSLGTLANAPGPTVNYTGAPGSSAQVTAQNLGQTRESTLGMLTTAARNAPIAASQQALQARAAHGQDLQKIQGQRASLAGQIGAYTTGRIDDLIGADRKLRHDANQAAAKLKASFVQAGVDPTTGQVVPGGPKDPNVTHPDRGPSKVAKPPSNFTGSPADWNNLSRSERDQWVSQHPTGAAGPSGVKPATPAATGSFKDRVGSAVNIVRHQKAGGDTRQEIAADLLNGRPAQTIILQPGEQGYDPNNPAKNKIHVPALPKTSQLALSVALDLAFDGHVSQRNMHELHRRGLSLRQLGFPTQNPNSGPSRAPH